MINRSVLSIDSHTDLIPFIRSNELSEAAAAAAAPLLSDNLSFNNSFTFFFHHLLLLLLRSPTPPPPPLPSFLSSLQTQKPEIRKEMNIIRIMARNVEMRAGEGRQQSINR